MALVHVIGAKAPADTASTSDLREDSKPCSKERALRRKTQTVSHLQLLIQKRVTKNTGAVSAGTGSNYVPNETNLPDKLLLNILEDPHSSPLFTLDKFTHPTYRQHFSEGYFHFFHQTHPFLPPRKYAEELLRMRPIPHLEMAMCYVASQYGSTASTANFALELETLLASANIPNDGYLVQALLLFVIGLDGNNEQLRALEVLTRAQRIAIELGMHQSNFAILNGRGLPVLEESWRRTWWELYVVNGLIAGLHQISTFQLFEIVANVPLPCEEYVFNSGVSPFDYLNLEATLKSTAYLCTIHT